MTAYILRRLLLFIPTAFGISVVIFVMMRVVLGNADTIQAYSQGAGPGATSKEALAAVRHDLGIDRPLVVQYGSWLGHLFQGDLGTSFFGKKSVGSVLQETFPRSLQLAIFTVILAVLVSIPLGVLSAARRGTKIDNLLQVFSVTGLTLPVFLTGMITIYVLSRYLHWLPAFGWTHAWDDPTGFLKQMIWPAALQAYALGAPMMRMTRSQMLEVLQEDYVRTAKAKGLRERTVIYRHALKNALLPVITLAGLLFGFLLSGQVVVERIFAIPGMGTKLLDSIITSDYPVVETFVLVLALWYLSVNLLVDLAYAWLDPRIRLK